MSTSTKTMSGVPCISSRMGVEKHPFDCIGHVFAVLCVSIKKLSEPCCESDIFSDSSMFVVL